MKHRHLYLPTFLPVAFPDAMETFLEDMAKKGWFLKKVGYFLPFCQFEKGTPAPVRYRLEPIPDTVRTPSQEMVQFYEEFGWKYLTPFSHFFFIFMAENPDTPEIHCDPLVQAKGYKRMCRNFSIFGLAALILLAIFLGIPLYHPGFLLDCPRFSGFSLITLLAFAVLILWSVLRLWKIYRNLSHGNPISHHKGYLHILSLQTIALALFVLFLLPFRDKLMEWDEKDQITQSLTAVEEPLPYVPLAEMGISPDWVQKPYAPITIGSEHSDSNYVRSTTNFLAPATFQISQTAYHTDPNMPAVATSMTSYYGEMSNSFLAKIVGMDLANLYASTPGISGYKMEKEPLSLSGFSEAYYGDLLGNAQLLLLRQGNRVLIVHYAGDASLKDHVEDFAELFTKTYTPLQKGGESYDIYSAIDSLCPI